MLASNDTNTSSPSMMPSISPTLMPSSSPTAYTIYDLNIRFVVEVKSKEESDKVYDTIKSYYFFNEFKQSLLDALKSDPFVLEHYKNDSRIAMRKQIESMQQAPFNDLTILSPTSTNYVSNI